MNKDKFVDPMRRQWAAICIQDHSGSGENPFRRRACRRDCFAQSYGK